MRVTLYPIPLKVSGAQTDRPELAKLLKCLGRGEVLMVTRLDRLARSRVTEMDLRDLRDGRASARQLGRWPTFLMRDIEEVEAKAAELRGEQRRAKLTTMAAKGWSAKVARPIASIACGSQAARHHSAICRQLQAA